MDEDPRYLAADGKPVVVGDRFHRPDQSDKPFEVWSIDQLFVYMRSHGWSGGPVVEKRWKMARKGWVRCG